MKIGRSTWPGLFLACIFVFCSVTNAWAQFSGGSGTSESPYQIASAQDLHNVRDYPNAHYIQSTNLDLNIAPFNQGPGWQAIGSSSAPFTGSFDGAGFSISGLIIRRSLEPYVALFAHTQLATFSNIHLLNCAVSGEDYTAALVACAQNTSFLDCEVTGSIAGAAYTAALVGSLELNSSIQNSRAHALVSGSFATGGLCGYAKGSAQISTSVSRGNVNGINAVGGLVGLLADSHLYDSYSAASVNGNRYVGGLLGTNDDQGLVEGCYARGFVSGNSSGGLIGRSVLGNCISSYWDTITSGQSSSAGGEGRNTQQMLPPYDATTYVDWDFASIWNTHQSYNGGYPYLNWEYTVPSNVALLVYDKNILNAYDTGFINVLNTIITDYDTIDIADISSGQSVLSNHRVVISNFMGHGLAAPTAFNSIAAELSAATAAGTEFIVGSESVALPVVLGLVNGTMNPGFYPAYNNTRAITSAVTEHPLTQSVNPIPNYQDYLGQEANMLASYFGEGVFWKVMSGSIGTYYTDASDIYKPVYRFNTIYSGWDVSDYPYPSCPKEYLHNNSRILHLLRFWTQNNETRSKGWIGPEGIQILSNAIDHYLDTDFVATPPSELSEVLLSSYGSQRTLHWNAGADVDYYEIWQSSDGQNWNPIGLQSEDGSASYAWLSPLSTDSFYRIRPILSDTPGAFIDATPAVAEVSVRPAFLSFSIEAGTEASESITISNYGLGTLEWTSLLTEVSPGLSVVLSPAQGTIASGDSLVCELSIASGSTEPGLYELTLQLDSNDPDQPSLMIPIAIQITSPLAYIPDDNFRMAINRELEQPEAYQPTIADLESIIFVEATGEGIVNLEGAQHLINMQGLYLDSNQISELGPISNLTHLQSLDLNYNQISDLSPLSNLTLLEILYMTDNQITELSPLSNMTLLRSLYLNNNQITELSPLSNMTLLERLYLYDNQITELGPLSSLANLQRLYLTNNQVSDLSPISSLTNLQGLTLSSNQISELSPLAGLSNLQWLTLAGNQINNIGPLSSLISLQDLDLSANQISDIWPLSGLINLNEFYLEANPISYESMLRTQDWSLPYIASSYEPLSPCYPDPEREATDIFLNSGLVWQANYNLQTAEYEVYLGASPQSLSYLGNGYLSDETSYAFDAILEPFTEYYWRVKAVEDTTTVWSGLWSFTTGETFLMAEIGVEPAFIYEELNLDESSELQITISNTGNIPLNWDSEIISMRANRAAQDRSLSISLEPAAGTIEAASYATCLLSFSHADTLGTYSYEIRIASNDPENPLLIVPVDYQVLSPLAYIPDDNFRMAINEALGQLEAYQPTIADLESLIGEFSANSRGIVHIEGAQHLRNLQILYLNDNQISDLSPLSSLNNLWILELNDNQISDISPLANLTNLNVLRLDNNQISDLNPLSSIAYLQRLDLRQNQISNLGPLSSLNNLYWLYLSNNPTNDLSPLSSLINMNGLELHSNQISDISILNSLINLQWLELSNNQISDLSPLSSLINLHTLYLSNNQISDLGPLIFLNNLGWLELSNNQISDISHLANLTNLRMLYLSSNQISELSPLSGLTNLQGLYLDGNRISDISPLTGFEYLYYLYLDNNPLSYESMLLSQSWTLLWSTSTYEPIAPCYPDPNRKAMDVDPSSELSWQANYAFTQAAYQVYLGEDPQSLSYIGNGYNVDGTEYAFETLLQPFTQYWWKVKAIYDTTAVWSGMWSFTTGEEIIPEEAIIAVTPEYIDHSLVQDSTDQVELEISNSGNAELAWSATIVDLNRRDETAAAPRPRVSMEMRTERKQYAEDKHHLLPEPPELSRTTQNLRDRDMLLALNPQAGIVQADSSMFCYLNIDSSGSLSGYYEYQIVISSNAVNEPELTIPVSITVTGTPAYIPDDNFRMAINRVLDQATDYQPTIADLESLSELYADDSGIYSIEGAQYLTNLQWLFLGYNQISDISPLSYLYNLRTLDLNGNQISELSPLAGLTNLEWLHLFYNQISDISPLNYLYNLQELYLGYNQISDISPLSYLYNLQKLGLNDNQVSDINPLNNISSLHMLGLSGNQISELSPLSYLYNLQELYLGYNQISDISPLASLGMINTLQLHDNPLSYESMLLSQSWSLPWFTHSFSSIAPCYPNPERNAMQVAPDAGLLWQANYRFSATVAYEVYLGTSPDALTLMGLGTLIGGNTYGLASLLNPFTDYYWSVKAIDDSTTVWSGLWSFSTGDAMPYLPAPTNLIADFDPDFEVTLLSWEPPVRSLLYYKIYRSITGSVSDLVYYDQSDSTSYVDYPESTESVYAVTAVYDEGESRMSNYAWVSRLQPVSAQLCIQPQENLSMLSWPPTRGATEYLIYWTDDPQVEFPQAWAGPYSSTDTNYILPLAERRFFRVMARIETRDSAMSDIPKPGLGD